MSASGNPLAAAVVRMEYRIADLKAELSIEQKENRRLRKRLKKAETEGSTP